MDGDDNLDDVQLTPAEIRQLQEDRDRLMSERDSERRRADAEANRADAAESQVGDAHRQLGAATVAGLSAQENAAHQAIETANAEIAEIKRLKVAFNEEGKFTEAADLDEKLADAVARRNSATNAKNHFANQRESAASTPADPVDRFLAANKFTDSEQQWIRQNRRYATDKAFQDRVNEAHGKALEAGLERYSPAYFKFLSDAGYMRTPAPAADRDPPPRRQSQRQQTDVEIDGDDDPYSSAAGGDEDDAPPPPPARPARQPQRPAMNAAPPSRRGNPAPRPGGENGDRVRLTPEQAETALSLSEYFPEDVQNGGDAAIYAYYAKLNKSPMANRKREEWAMGA